MTRSWSLRYEARPWSVNQQVRMHWSWKHERVAEWRHAFEQLALAAQLPELEAATVSCRAQLGKGGRRYDAGNDYYALKAALDGIVDAGVLPDDGPNYVHAVTLEAPVKGDGDLFTLTVTEVQP